MKVIIHVYNNLRFKIISASQSNLLHLQGIVFKRIAIEIPKKLFEVLKEA